MEFKIYRQVKFTDKNTKIYHIYKFVYNKNGHWISEKDFENTELLIIKKDSIILKDPIKENYSFEKRKNRNGIFSVAIPKIKQENNKVQEELVAYKKGIKNQNDEEKNIGKALGKLSGEIDAIMTSSEAEAMTNIQKYVYPNRKIHEQTGLKKLEKVKPKKNISNEQTNISTKNKIRFINNLLDYSINKKVDDKTREKLFTLIGKEIEKTENVGDEIIERLERIEGFITNESKNEQKDKKKDDSVKPHRPKDTADFMSLFNNRGGLKYLTHDFDEDEIFDIKSFLKKAEDVFKKQATRLSIPRDLYAIIEQFAFTKKCDKKPDWLSIDESFNDKKINTGWSTDDWRNWSKKNKLHPIRNDSFKSVINDFRKVTRIETPMLEALVNNLINLVFDDENSDFNYNLSNLDKADFYTHTRPLKKALKSIFKLIKKYDSSKTFSVNYKRDTDGDYFVRNIEITHKKSYPTKELNLLLKEWNSEKGDMGRIQKNLKGYCNWSIETLIENNPVRINILKEEGTPDKEILDKSKIEGFKHILTFYYK